MLRFLSICCSLLILASCTGALGKPSASNQLSKAQCSDPGVDPALLVTQLAKRKKFPGIAVAVAYGDNRTWSHGSGFAEIASASPIQPRSTKFRIGSTSKSLTAFLLARLAQQKKIDLDQSVRESLTELPQAYDGVTLRQLAGHLGGVRHYASQAELGNTITYRSSEDALTIFVEDPLVASPGSEFNYSTYGYTLISAVLERELGLGFLSIMSNEVFAPLQMDHTLADTSQIQPPDRTEFYYLNEEGEPIIGPEIDNSNKWAGGGFLASVVDLARFGKAHFDDGLLSKETRDTLWTSQNTSTGEATEYGMGWFVEDGWVEHPGGALGGSTLLRIYPDQELVIAMSANLSVLGEGRFDELPDQLFECFSRN